jgi:beta-1,4-mannosyltransferase
MKKIKAYMYPISSRGKSSVYNPYIDNFMQYTSEFIDYLNRTNPSNKGFLDIAKYIFNIDVIFLNWIENVPDRKGGIMQFLAIFTILKLKNLFKIKIVWTIHNKISHSTNMMFLKKYLFKELLKKSDLLITHSKEGISFAESMIKGCSNKVFYYPHPILKYIGDEKDNSNANKEYDVLIWGTMVPYKGIHLFLENLKQKYELNKLKILIIGKVPSSDYYDVLRSYENDNISIQNKFVKDNELSVIMNLSKVVLFTYSNDSILSSGVLMDSLAHGAFVIGPNTGAFKDVREDFNIVKTYDNFDELIVLLKNIDEIKSTYNKTSIQKFVELHSWENFGNLLKVKLS